MVDGNALWLRRFGHGLFLTVRVLGAWSSLQCKVGASRRGRWKMIKSWGHCPGTELMPSLGSGFASGVWLSYHRADC